MCGAQECEKHLGKEGTVLSLREEGDGNSKLCALSDSIWSGEPGAVLGVGGLVLWLHPFSLWNVL